MRLIHLRAGIPGFGSPREVERYFESPDSGFRAQGKNGVFPVPEGKFSEGEFHSGETVLFALPGTVLYCAQALSGRLPSREEDRPEYPYCFEVDLKSIRRVSFSVAELAASLRFACGWAASLAPPAWPILPAGKVAEEVVKRLCEETKTKWVEERFGVGLMKDVPKEVFDEFVRLGREARDAIP